MAYAARGSIVDPGAIGKTKAFLRKACEVQLAGAGFAIVEILSNCPVGWGMTPQESIERLGDAVAKVYPPGVLVDRTRPAPTPAARSTVVPTATVVPEG